MRHLLPSLLLVPALAAAQTPSRAASQLSRADSVLLYEVLSAEDRRDASAPALAAGAAHSDPRIAAVAQRAIARLRDSSFAERELLGQPDPSRPFPRHPEPEWANRYRALGGRDGECAPLIAALDDAAPQVRQRAIALVGLRRSCVGQAGLPARLHGIVHAGRGEVATHRRGEVSWHLAAEALVSLARIAPDSSSAPVNRLSTHSQPQLRRAAARAAVFTRDTALLGRLLDDRDPNVLEAALNGLATLRGRSGDATYARFIARREPQVALAAAKALKGTMDAEILRAAGRALDAVAARNWASERDIREALRAVLGQPTSEAWQPGQPDSLPFDVVALALGARRYVEVRIADEHGGGRFVVELRGDIAPIQSARVLALLRAGKYDGTTWHRVEPNFVIQGGSPHDNEYSGSGRFVVDELATAPHPRGSIGMSTRGHSTGDLQWFVNLRDNARLTAAYTVFAMVVEGMDVVDDVLEGDRIATMREVPSPRPSRP